MRIIVPTMTRPAAYLMQLALAMTIAVILPSVASHAAPTAAHVDGFLLSKICRHTTPSEPARATDSCEPIQSFDRRDDKTWPVVFVHDSFAFTIARLPYRIARENFTTFAAPQRYPLIESHRGPPANRA